MEKCDFWRKKLWKNVMNGVSIEIWNTNFAEK